MEKAARYATHPNVIPFPAKRATMMGGETAPYLPSRTSIANPATVNVVQLAAHLQTLARDLTPDAGDGHRGRP
jgi:hypothetical protein